MGLFCSEFFTDSFYVVHFGPTRTTYAKIGKNFEKLIKIWPTLDSNFSKLGSKLEKSPRQIFSLLIHDSETVFGLILSCMGFSKKVSFLRPSILTFDIKFLRRPM